MLQVNMPEEKTDLSDLINLLETHREDSIYLARNGNAIAKITLLPVKSSKKRIGVAEGKFDIPDDFDAWDEEIEKMFEEQL